MARSAEQQAHDDKRMGSLKVEYTVTAADIDNITSTAYSGALTYWATCILVRHNEENRPDCIDTGISRGGEWIICIEKGSMDSPLPDGDFTPWKTECNTLRGLDIPIDAVDGYKLTLEKLLTGLQLYADKHLAGASTLEEIAELDLDGSAVDLIVQYALFGEVVFG